MLSENIKFISTHCETKQRSSLSVYEARTNKLYIFRQCTYIVYISYHRWNRRGVEMEPFFNCYDTYTFPNGHPLIVRGWEIKCTTRPYECLVYGESSAPYEQHIAIDDR
jgi:hypothetical protein